MVLACFTHRSVTVDRLAVNYTVTVLVLLCAPGQCRFIFESAAPHVGAVKIRQSFMLIELWLRSSIATWPPVESNLIITSRGSGSSPLMSKAAKQRAFQALRTGGVMSHAILIYSVGFFGESAADVNRLFAPFFPFPSPRRL